MPPRRRRSRLTRSSHSSRSGSSRVSSSGSATWHDREAGATLRRPPAPRWGNARSTPDRPPVGRHRRRSTVASAAPGTSSSVAGQGWPSSSVSTSSPSSARSVARRCAPRRHRSRLRARPARRPPADPARRPRGPATSSGSGSASSSSLRIRSIAAVRPGSASSASASAGRAPRRSSSGWAARGSMIRSSGTTSAGPPGQLAGDPIPGPGSRRVRTRRARSSPRRSAGAGNRQPRAPIDAPPVGQRNRDVGQVLGFGRSLRRRDGVVDLPPERAPGRCRPAPSWPATR